MAQNLNFPAAVSVDVFAMTEASHGEYTLTPDNTEPDFFDLTVRGQDVDCVFLHVEDIDRQAAMDLTEEIELENPGIGVTFNGFMDTPISYL